MSIVGIVVRRRNRNAIAIILATSTLLAADMKLSGLWGISPTLARAAESVKPRYNVLFLPCDDLNPCLGCFGNKVVQTPNIDKLAARGVRFTQAYSQFASCLPSRASFLSGWYPERTGVLDFSPKARDGVMKDVVYLPQHFRNHGYFTARLDKVFHINADDPISWDVTEEPLPGPNVTWEAREVEALGLQDRVLRERRYKVRGEGGIYAVLDVNDEQPFDGMKTNRAIQLIEQSAKEGKAFFLACGYRRPHLPWIAPKKYFDLYPPEKIVLPPPNPNDTEQLSEAEHREMLAHYYAGISYLDAQVGRLLDALDRLNLRENTIVVLFGDNGYCLGERGMHFGKGNLWERSLWVPLVISLPGAARNGQACTRSVGLIDMYPTLVELCGLPQPESGLQGRSLAPLIHGDDPNWKEQTIISVFPIKEGSIGQFTEGSLGRSVRTDRYRYSEDGTGTPLELIDYQNDPYEWKNLVNDPQHKELRTRLRAILHEDRQTPGKTTAENFVRGIPRPLEGHPGNVYLAEEEVCVTIPSDKNRHWTVRDYEGRQLLEGTGAGRICLGRLPVGYYEVQWTESVLPTTVAVVAPLLAPTPLTSPIGVDVATAWLLSGGHATERVLEGGQKMPINTANVKAAASLCALAGMNRVRDRLSWPEMEPQRGQFATDTRYDMTAREQSAAGLQVLQVNHSTPKWAGLSNDWPGWYAPYKRGAGYKFDGKPWVAGRNRFPNDLRDVYRFYREMARRWKGQVQSFEPWNEADWCEFGGHTGSEIASLQKAAYLGLKAGNPEVIVCQNAFSSEFRKEIHPDFHANEAWAYFDTYNFHHYRDVDKYPAYYADHRPMSAGRPLWITECNVPVKWSYDPKVGEPLEARKLQAERVAKVFAASLHERAAAVFFFILPNFGGKGSLYGILHPDLTPRPGYLALAAVGRLLADARPLGKMKAANPELHGFLFHARPDGQERGVLVAWSNSGTAALTLPVKPTAVFDHLGRKKNASDVAEVCAAPIFVLMPLETVRQFSLESPPAAVPWAEGKPSPVVLQAVWPQERAVWAKSAYQVNSRAPENMPLYVYNFSDDPVEGRLSIVGPKAWKITLPERVSVPPGGRSELSLTLDPHNMPSTAPEAVSIAGDFEPAARAILSLQVLAESTSRPREKTP